MTYEIVTRRPAGYRRWRRSSLTVAGLSVARRRGTNEANLAFEATPARPRRGRAVGARRKGSSKATSATTTPIGPDARSISPWARPDSHAAESSRAGAELKMYLAWASRSGAARCSIVRGLRPGQVDGAALLRLTTPTTSRTTRPAQVQSRHKPTYRWEPLICYDRRMPETSRILAIRGARSSWFPPGAYDEMNDALMRTRAFEAACGCVRASQALPDHQSVWQDRGQR
jgi:hypothetical protein